MDGGLKVDDRSEDAALQPTLCELGEKAFDSVEPGARCRRKVEGEAFVALEPLAHLGVLVSGIIVEDHMHELAGGNLRLDGVEEADKFLMAVTLHVAANHFAVEHVERSEQRGRSVPFVVMRQGSGAALLHRQTGLGAIKRLYLALLVDAEHDGVRRRIDIEPDDSAQFGDEVRIVGELEQAQAVWLKPVRAPDALNRADGNADGLRHHRAGPMRRFARRVLLRQGDDPFGDVLPERSNARRAGLVAKKAVNAFLHEPCLPAPDAGLRRAGLAHDLVRADAVSGEQNDPGPPDMLLSRVPVLNDGLKPLPIGRRQRDGDSRAHRPDSHAQ